MNQESEVKIWEEKVTIPTYEVSNPDPNPRFYEKRAYQGSSGKVYPLPVTEKISDEKTNKEYTAVFMENTYLKVMFLPELGGRIQRATDKTNHYDFVYYNHVIKPALVGLTGPWISGGIEFNWPQHHRPSTFEPTEYKLSEHKDGSKTLYVSEIDKMYGTKGMAAFTLYPKKALIEIKGQLYNRTELPQTFLWWANPAVPANDDTFSVFPPDVTAVMDHGKRAVSTFPIATGEYYKVDYSSGVDISKYKNIPVPTSYMAEKSDYDFIGNYDEGVQAGLLHVADHHVSPGKKQWTWGNADFGQAWDYNLTDEDGPYVELMTGVFTDNQPDFSWLRPYEEKVFTQHFMPYKGAGYLKNATIDGAVNLTRENGMCDISVYVTGEEKNMTVSVKCESDLLFEDTIDLTPETFYQNRFSLNEEVAASDLLTITVKNGNGETIVEYNEVDRPEPTLPDPADEIPKPEELLTTEELFLAATHLEQYRHATREPQDYYLEGLKRDKTDIRLNTGYGTWLYRHGRFDEAEKHLRQAVEKQTWKTPNPYYGEPLFQLGLVLEMQGKTKEAYDTFYKATWNEDTQSSTLYRLASLAMQKKDYRQARDFIERALVKNAHHMKARLLEILILKKLDEESLTKIDEALEIDPLDLAINRLKYQQLGKESEYQKIMRGDLQNFLTIALDYRQFGLYDEAIEILNECPVESPMIGYYTADLLTQVNKVEDAKEAILKAENANPLYCFPSRLDEIVILEKAIELKQDAYYAKYYLGNLLYDKKQYDRAIMLWEKAADGLRDFPTVFRNLSFAYYNKRSDGEKALEFINQAYKLNPNDARILLEKTQLEGMLNVSVKERLETLENHLEVTKDRDDLFIEYLTLLNLEKRYEAVLSLISERQFHPWEGGEGKVSEQYTYALIESGKEVMASDPNKANQLFNASKHLPRNLGEGKLPSNHDNIANYYLGKLYEAEKNQEKAKEYFRKATRGITEPGSVLYYNDVSADVLYYQGLGHDALKEHDAADQKYEKLIQYGEEHLYDDVEWDFFAVSAPAHSIYDSDIQLDNSIYCLYLIGLGKLGKKKDDEARRYFEKVLDLNPAHQGAIRHLPFTL